MLIHYTKRFLAVIMLMFCSFLLKAQSVDIGLFEENDTLEVRLLPGLNFNGIVSNVQFSIRWNAASGANLGATIEEFPEIGYIPMQKSGPETDDSGYRYQVFFGSGSLGMNVFGISWTAGNEVVLLRLPITNGCSNFAIVNDAWTGNVTNNGDYFLSLGGVNYTGTMYGSAISTCAGGCSDVSVNNDQSICDGDSLLAGGAYQTTSGTYNDTFALGNGCDSIRITSLTVLSHSSSTVDTSICDGESYLAGGANQTTTGTYYDTLTAANGCDSIITTNLVVLANAGSSVDTSICNGESYFAGGASQTATGTYYDTLTGANSCDSIVITNLTVINNPLTTIDTTICDTDSVLAGGGYQTTTGLYYDTLVAGNGCDSIVETDVSVISCVGLVDIGLYQTNDSLQVRLVPHANFNGIVSNLQFTIRWDAASGANLGTINEAFPEIGYIPLQKSGTETDDSGFRYQVFFGSSSTPMSTFGASWSVGTPVVLLTLPILNGCSDFAIVNDGWTADVTNNGDYFISLAGNNTTGLIITSTVSTCTGCTDITANASQSICDGDSLFVGGAYQTTAGTYSDTFALGNGCDSIITTTLTLLANTGTTVNPTICNGESYFAGGANQTTTGTYYDTLPAANGCDSVITTNLAVLTNSFNSIDTLLCDMDSIFAGGGFQTTTGSYYDTLIAANTCDSVVETNITVIPCGDVVDIGLFKTNDSLQVRLLPHLNFNGIVSNLQFTIRWDASSGASLGAIKEAFPEIGYIPMQKSGLETDDSGYRYQVFFGSSSTPLSTFGAGWTTGTEVILLTLPIDTGCSDFVIANDAWTADVSNNGDYFLSLGGSNSTGIIYGGTVTTCTGTCSDTIINQSQTICDGDSLLIGGAYQTTTGTYNDTFSMGNGCDSIIVTDLTVLLNSFTFVDTSICDGESYFAEGANQTTTGAYNDTLTAANGCDSIVTTNLTVLPVALTVIDTSVCNGESYFAGGGLQDTSGTYFDTLIAASGCDSIITTNLTVLSASITNDSTGICSGDSLFVGGGFQTTAGIYTDTLVDANGCDSLVITSLTVNPLGCTNPNASNYDSTAVCDDGSCLFASCTPNPPTGTPSLPVADSLPCLERGKQYFEAVFLENFDTLSTSFGTVQVNFLRIDSITNLPDSIGWVSSDSANTFLGGETGCIQISGTTFDSIGQYQLGVWITLEVDVPSIGTQTFNGEAADVIAQIEADTGPLGIDFDFYLTVINSGEPCPNLCVTTTDTVSVSICNGESYFAGGDTQSVSGTYTDTLVSNVGCDSIVVTELNVLLHSSSTVDVDICNGDSLLVGGAYQTTTGIYVDTIAAANTCDSIVTTNLTVIPSAVTVVDTSICNGDSYFAGGTNQTTTGVYFDTLTAANSCDSIVTTNLTVIPSAVTVIDTSICNGESYFAGGAAQTTTGIYSDTLTAANGCDSIVTTQLTVIADGFTSIDTTVCDSDSLFAGGAFQTTTGSYYDTLAAVSGCDSIIETNLTVRVCGDLVDIGLFKTNDTLEVRLLPNLNFNGIVSNVQFTIRWDASSGASLGAIKEAFPEIGYIPMQKSGPETDDSGYRYQVFFGSGSLAMSNFSTSWTAGTERLLLRVPVTNSCSDFAIVNDSWTTNVSNNGDYFISLGGDNSTGIIYTSTVSTCTVVCMDTTVSQDQVICQGDSLFVGGGFQTTTGTYTDTFSLGNSCDSIVVTDLTVLQNSLLVVDTSICDGESYFAGGANQTTSGTYNDTLTAANGCDSVITTDLTVLPVAVTVIDTAICNGENYFAGGASQSTSGTYLDTLTASYGCDSIVTTNLTVLSTSVTNISPDICDGDSLFAGGAFQSTTGTYTDTLTDANGCDSIVITTLTVNPSGCTNPNATNYDPAAVCNDGSCIFTACVPGVPTGNPGLTPVADSLACIERGVFYYEVLYLENLDTVTASIGNVQVNYLRIDSITNLPDSIGWESSDTANTFLAGETGCIQVSGTTLDSTGQYPLGIWITIEISNSLIGTQTFNGEASALIAQIEAITGPLGIDFSYYVTVINKGEPCPNLCETTTDSISASICAGESYFAGGANQTTAGTYTDSLVTNAGCDSVVVTELTVLPNSATTVNVDICDGESYLAGGANQTTTGTYFDTLIAANTCDSIVTTNLTVLPNTVTVIDTAICDGESYFAEGSNQTTTGTYFDTLTTANGCDSVITTNLAVLPGAVTIIDTAICDGQSYFAGGANQTTTGTYFDTLPAASGCDSIITTNLTILSAAIENVLADICDGDSLFVGGAFQTTAGAYNDTFTAANGCDSILITTLTVHPLGCTNPNASNYDPAAVCDDGSCIFNACTPNAPTGNPGLTPVADSLACIERGVSYYEVLFVENFDTVSSPLGTVQVNFLRIDSITNLPNGINWQSSDSANTFLAGETGCIQISGTTFDPSGQYQLGIWITIEIFHPLLGTQVFSNEASALIAQIEAITGPLGIDFSYYVTVINPNEPCPNLCETTTDSISASICDGESYFAGGASQTAAGTYTDTLTSSIGCDSVIVTELSVLPNSIFTVDAVICNGESYFAGGANQTSAGVYYDTLTAANSCDSIVVTDLAVLPNTQTTRTIDICDGDSVFAGGQFQTVSGTYFDTLMAANTCDSVVTTVLSVLTSFTSNQQVTLCTGDSLFVGGDFQTTGGIYSDTLTSVGGCDSIVTTDLGFVPFLTRTVQIDICDGDSVLVGGAYQTASGLYYDTIASANSCDSIIITDLNVLTSISVNVQASICAGDSIFVGGDFQTVSGVYYDTIAAAGCDSVIITNLSVVTSLIRNVLVSICHGESYFVGGAFQTTSGTYYDTLTSVTGCDSIIITDLSFLDNSTDTVDVSICDGDSYFAGGANQTTSGTYIDTLAAFNGCDSILVTNLDVVTNLFTSVDAYLCTGDSLFVGGDYQYITGTYYDTLVSNIGCDSVIETNLIVDVFIFISRQIDICVGESWAVGSSLYTTSGTYNDTLIASFGCDSIIETNLTVHPLPVVSFIIPSSICTGESPITLVGTPPGGIFTGPGVVGNVLNPAILPVGGPFTMTYEYTDIFGCSNTATRQFSVSQSPMANFTGLSPSYCVDAAAVQLVAGTPGGSFSGPGVAGNTFVPFFAGVGTHQIKYTIPSQVGCDAVSVQTTTVNPLPTVSIGNLSSNYCFNDMPVTLTTTPGGGVLSGDGIVGNTFDPGLAGTGSHQVTYSYTDANGCSNKSTKIVLVKTIPTALIIGLQSIYCVDDDSVSLIGNPAGGVFSGPGITGNFFDPTVAGVGNHVITYYYVAGNACGDSATRNVTVEVCPGIDQPDFLENVQVYPNPFTDDINVEIVMGNNTNLPVDVILRDVVGKAILKSEYQLKGGENKFILSPGRDLAAGLYILELRSEKNRYLHKLLRVE